MKSPEPIVGEWYRRPNGSLVEVVAVDRDDDSIEVQHFDGTVEEFDGESWAEQSFEEAQPPEDWTGSVDVEPEDLEADAESSDITWSESLRYLDRTEAIAFSEWPASGDRLY